MSDDSEAQLIFSKGRTGLSSLFNTAEVFRPLSNHPQFKRKQEIISALLKPNHLRSLAYDIAYWSKKFGVTRDQLHEVIRSHRTPVEKVRAALHFGTSIPAKPAG
jgi:hypothetical protein